MRSGISIDVDAMRFYGAIHGLPKAPGENDPIYRLALPRFFDLLDEVGVPSTVFFVAEDLPLAGESLRAGLAATGSELASHSFAHDYRLGVRPKEEIRDDLGRAHAALSEAAGTPVVGFRAPGYNTTPAMLECLVELGYRYDSSLLPAPAYFGARAAAIARYQLLGRPSASLVGDLRAFWGPRGPYRTVPAAPWRKVADGPLVELPMGVVPGVRFPLIGTSWVMLPRRLRMSLLRLGLLRTKAFTFEMHAIDLLDGSDPGVPPEVASAQPDLAVPLRKKLDAFRELFRYLRDHSEVSTLASLAQQIDDA